MIKKFINVLLTVALMFSMFSIAGCTDNTNSDSSESNFNYNTDMQYYYNNISNAKLACTESDKGYYYRGDHGIVLFIDKKSMEGIPLCNKTNCMHNDPDVCDAYGYGSIQYNDGYLYTDISEYDSEKMSDVSYIFRVSEDGTEKEKITDGFSETLLEWFIHRSYIYCLTNTGLYSIPLSSPKSEPKVIISFKELGSENVNIDKFIAYENYVYVSVSALLEEESSEDNNFTHLFAFDIESEKYSEIDFNGATPNIATFIDGKMITYKSVKNDDDSYNTIYYISDLNGDNREKFAEYPSGNYLYSDGKYVYVDNGAYLNFSEDIDYENPEKNIFGQTIKVYDLKMKEIGSFILPFDGWIDMCAQGTKHFLISAVAEDGNYELYYLDKNEIPQYKGTYAVKKEVCPLNWKNLSNTSENNNIKVDNSVAKKSELLNNYFSLASEKGYKISDQFSVNNSNIIDGFSVKIHWTDDGGEYTGNFPVLAFNSEQNASKFCDENGFCVRNKSIVAIVSIEKVPVEIYSMLNSIINGDPIVPISPDDFSGETVTIA